MHHLRGVLILVTMNSEPLTDVGNMHVHRPALAPTHIERNPLNLKSDISKYPSNWRQAKRSSLHIPTTLNTPKPVQFVDPRSRHIDDVPRKKVIGGFRNLVMTSTKI